MKTINTKWLWGIASLLALNLVLLLSMFFMGNSEKRPKPSPFLEEALHFTEPQTREFHALRKEHHQKMMERNEEIRKLKDRFFEGITRDVPKVETDAINQKIGELVAEIDRITFEHFKEVRALCTPEQEKEFDKIITELLHGGGRQPGQPMPGPPNGKRGPGPPPNSHGGRPF